MTLTKKAKALLATNPTEICTVHGITFYEHPTLGDEVGFCYISKDGNSLLSNFYEIPSVEDVIEMLENE